MSTSKDVKSEIINNNDEGRGFRVARLAGFIKFSSVLVLLGENNFGLRIKTQNPKVARFIKNELEEVFSILTILTIHETSFKNRNSYELMIQTTEERFKDVFVNLGVLEKYEGSHILCSKMPQYFLKYKKSIKGYVSGVFLAKGYMSNPSVNYRLSLKNLTIQDIKILKPLITRLKQFDINFKKSKDCYVIYSIENVLNFLALINAKEIFHNLNNILISKSVNVKFNRVNNITIKNEEKIISSANKYISLIRKNRRKKIYKELPEEIKETFSLRLKKPILSIEELAKLHKKKTSKSQVYRRLKSLEKLFK